MNRFILGGVLSTLLSMSIAARAQATPSAYVALSAGPSRSNVDCSGTSTCDKTSAFAKVLLGYRLIPNLAVEASYAYLGKVKATATDGVDTVAVSIKGQSLGLGIAGLLPFGPDNAWTGIARVGIASNRARVNAIVDNDSASDSESHTEPYFGLGLNYTFSPNFDGGVAFDSTKVKYSGVSNRANALSVVATFKF